MCHPCSSVATVNFGACGKKPVAANAKRARAATLFFSHPDFNRRLWNFTKSTAEPAGALAHFCLDRRVAGYTAGSDFH
jgi:hypothetical protein